MYWLFHLNKKPDIITLRVNGIDYSLLEFDKNYYNGINETALSLPFKVLIKGNISLLLISGILQIQEVK